MKVVSLTHVDGVRERAGRLFEANYRDMATDPDASGGSLIPGDFLAVLKRLVETYGVFARFAFPAPMASDSTSFPKQTGEPVVYLLEENTAGTTSEPTFANVGLAAKEWGTLTLYPRNLEEDSAIEVGEIVARSVSWAFAYKQDLVGFNGDGTSTYFGIEGIIPKLLDINGVDEGGGLILGSGDTFAELTIGDHEKMCGELPAYAGSEPRWFCHRKYFWTVMARLELAAGGTTAEEIAGRRQRTFLGEPVEFVQCMPKTDAVSQIACLYGDLRQAACIGNRRSLEIETSREWKFGERQVAVLGRGRFAITVDDVGTATEAGPMIGLITAAA